MKKLKEAWAWVKDHKLVVALAGGVLLLLALKFC